MRPRAIRSVFEVAVIGHLRRVKDPFRAAYAVRGIDRRSRVRIVQIGQALSDSMQRLAEAEMRRNRRYTWLGELPHWKTRQRLAAFSVAGDEFKNGGWRECTLRGNRGKRSGDLIFYPGSHRHARRRLPGGYFEYGNTEQLRERIWRCETEQKFVSTLKAAIDRRRPLVDPTREKRSWRDLIRQLH